MQRREGRMGHPELEPEASDRTAYRLVVHRTWERQIFVGAMIVILMLGIVGGVNAAIGLFPR